MQTSSKEQNPKKKKSLVWCGSFKIGPPLWEISSSKFFGQRFVICRSEKRRRKKCPLFASSFQTDVSLKNHVLRLACFTSGFTAGLLSSDDVISRSADLDLGHRKWDSRPSRPLAPVPAFSFASLSFLLPQPIRSFDLGLEDVGCSLAGSLGTRKRTAWIIGGVGGALPLLPSCGCFCWAPYCSCCCSNCRTNRCWSSECTLTRYLSSSCGNKNTAIVYRCHGLRFAPEQGRLKGLKSIVGFS